MCGRCCTRCAAFRALDKADRVAAAALGADGGRRSRRRIVRARAAARGGRRRRHLRHDASARGRRAAACSCCWRAANRSLAWPARTHGRREADPARIVRALERAIQQAGGEMPHRRRRHAHRSSTTSARAAWSLVGRRRDRGTRRDLRRRSEAHVPRAVRSDRPAARVPVADEALSIARHAREGQPGALGAAVVHRRRRARCWRAAFGSAPDLDYLERAFDHAKYGRFSPEPCDRVHDSRRASIPSLAPPGAHVLSAYVQFAPYRLRDSDWDQRARRPRATSRSTRSSVTRPASTR